MDLSDEWKSHIREDSKRLSTVFAGETSENFDGSPFPNSEIHQSDFELLFSSRSLCPPLLSPCPRFFLSRFLSTSADVPPSASSYIAAKFGDLNPNDDALPLLSYNRLQILPCPGQYDNTGNQSDPDSVLMFFPTGPNCDQVGFLLLSVEDSSFRVIGSDKGGIFVAKERLFSRIMRILVKPAEESCNSSVNIGYVMVYTLYSVHWYCVKHGGSQTRPVLRYLGCKQFKSCSIASASWSPHLHGECLVLLENGVIFLFDVNDESNGYLRGNRIKVPWGNQGKPDDCCWLGCEFSWHPRIFIAARSDAVFLIDTRSGQCKLTCLMDASDGRQQFLAFAKADVEGFRYILASCSLVYLCDVQRSLMPLVQWSHDVKKLCFIEVHNFSELMSGKYADERGDGSCVILGSFWDSQFSMFYCGSSASDGTDLRSLYSRELPYSFLFAGHCCCGDCILREKIAKDSFRDWIDWQTKKEVILGFGFLNKYLRLNSDQSSGFSLIRLTSSGKLEVRKCCFDSLKDLEAAHRNPTSESDEDNLLYLVDNSDNYKFPKRFKYLELDYLYAYMKGNLVELIDSKIRTNLFVGSLGKDKSFSMDAHEALCQKLHIFGKDRVSPAVVAVFDDISVPTSLFEIALKQTWSSLPTELLLLAFSNSEFLDVLLNMEKVSLEFLDVPDIPQSAPFLLRKPSCQSSKCSHKERSDKLVGPVLPLPVLVTLHELRNGCPDSQHGFSPEDEFSHQCDQVSRVVKDMAVPWCDSAGFQSDETKIVSLGDDRDDVLDDDSRKQKAFITYKPFKERVKYSSTGEDGRLTTFVSKVKGKGRRVAVEPLDGKGGYEGEDDKQGKTGLDLFNDLSPVDLKFEHRAANFRSSDMLNMKTQLSQWQTQFTPYKEFLSHYNLHT